MPSGGLIDKPQDAKFYDWHLRDPKDRPYATFQFHYRSWDSLVSLQLIPENHPRTLLPASPSLLSLNGQLIELQEELEAEEDNRETKIKVDEVSLEHRRSESSENPIPWTTVFDDGPSCYARNLNSRTGLLRSPDMAIYSPYYRPTNHAVSPLSSPINGISERPTVQNQQGFKQISDRPLPELPQRSSSLAKTNHSRSSSIISHAPSITPSLRSYYERDGTSPEPIIGVAIAVPLLPPLSPETPEEDDGDSDSIVQHYAEDSTEHSAATENLSKCNSIAFSSPIRRVIYSTNIVARRTQNLLSSSQSPSDHPFHSTSPSSPLSTSQPSLKSSGFAGKSQLYEGEEDDNEESYALDYQHSSSPKASSSPSQESHLKLENTSTLSLTESEWMCHTPSPVRKNPEHTRINDVWSLGGARHRSLEENPVWSKKGQESYGDRHCAEDQENELSELLDDTAKEKFGKESDFQTGNWI
jgi:hypothetical protein